MDKIGYVCKNRPITDLSKLRKSAQINLCTPTFAVFVLTDQYQELTMNAESAVPYKSAHCFELSHLPSSERDMKHGFQIKILNV